MLARHKRELMLVLLSLLSIQVVNSIRFLDKKYNTDEHIHIISLNDFHGRLDVRKQNGRGINIANTLCHLTNLYKLNQNNSIVLSAGDNFGASGPVSKILDENPTVAYLNSLGLKFSVLGNHEFDEGSSKLFSRLKPQTHTPLSWTYLAANVHWKHQTKTLQQQQPPTPFPISASFLLNGLKIGLVGVLTSDTANNVLRSGITDIRFGNMTEDTLIALDSPEIIDADIRVLLVHDGFTQSQHLDEWNSPLTSTRTLDNSPLGHLIKHTTGRFDLIISAHTHQVYSWTLTDGVNILQGGSYGRYLVHSKIKMNGPAQRASVNSTLVEVRGDHPCTEGSAGFPQFNRTRAVLRNILRDFNKTPENTRVMGTSPIHMASCLEVAGNECPLANLMAVALRDFAEKEYYKNRDNPNENGNKELVSLPPNPQLVALMNWGSLRDSLPEGEVRKVDLLAMMPFDNYVESIQMSEKSLRKLLLSEVPRLMSVSGITVTYGVDPASGENFVTFPGSSGDNTPYLIVTTNYIAQKAGAILGGEISALPKSGDPVQLEKVFVEFLNSRSRAA